MKITKTQIKNLKKFRNFLKLSENRNYYGQNYNHSSFNTCAIGIIAHANLFPRNNVRYNNVSFGLADNIESTNMYTIAENSEIFWGSYLYDVIFGSDSAVCEESSGLDQYDVLVEVINKVIAEYEDGISAKVAQTGIKAHASRLTQIAELLQHLSADDKVRYGLVNADTGKMVSDAELLNRFA